MKKLLLLLALIYSTFANAQVEFAPIGAKWYFTDITFSNIFNPATVVTFSCTDTVTIQGKLCKQIDKLGVFYQEGKKVFFYSKKEQRFVLIYNFGAKKGESWHLRPWLPSATTDFLKDSSKITIDSVYQENILGENRTVQLIKITKYPNTNPVLWSKKIIEGIGNLFFVLPGFGCCEFPYVELRCYEQNGQVHSFLKANQSCDKYTSSVDIATENIQYELFPNPAQNQIVFKLENQEYKKGDFLLSDLQGRQIATYPLLPNQDAYNFDISQVQNGIYIWQLVLDDKVRQSGKVVVLKE